MHLLRLLTLGGLLAFATSQHQETVVNDRINLRRHFQRSLEVKNGIGSGSYNLAESKIRILADCSIEYFREWIIDYGDPKIEDLFSAETTVIMPAAETKLVTPPQQMGIRASCGGPSGSGAYTLTVNGASGSGNYNPGDKIQLNADCGNFRQWIIEYGNPKIDDTLESRTMLTMPSSDASIRVWCNTKYRLFIYTGLGTGGQDYLPGSKVNIQANCNNGYFRYWISDYGGAKIANKFAPATTLTMPYEGARVSAYCQYTLTVNGASGSGEYNPGDKIQLNPSCHANFFRQWIIESGNPKIDDVTKGKTILTMPSENVSIRGKCNTKYKLYINNGNSTSGQIFLPGTEIDIEAYCHTGLFRYWIVDTGDVEIYNKGASKTTLTTQSSFSRVRAFCKYALTVNGASGSGAYMPGDEIKLDATCAGKYFRNWIIEYGKPAIDDVSSNTTTLTMPSADASVRANCNIKYKLYIDNGRNVGGANFLPGTKKVIKAKCSSGYFRNWIVDYGNAKIDDKFAAETTLTMPYEGASVSANCQYALIVNFSRDGYYDAADEIRLDAGCGNFRKWIIEYGNPAIENMNVNTTTLTMPSGDASVRADCNTKYTVYINNGADTGGGNFLPGSRIYLKAKCSIGYFRYWIYYGDAQVDDTFAVETTFTMPYESTRVSAYCQE